MKKNSIYIILILLVGGIFFIPGIKEKLQEQFFPIATVQSASTISQEDYDVQLKGINVPDANLKDFRGKIVFLNFWGTWCPPCREEWPTIQALYEAKKNKVDFVLIAMQDKEEAVRKYLAENQFTAPVYIAESPISKNLLPKSFPTTYILAPSGQILKKEDVSLDWNKPEIHQFIDGIAK